MIDAFAEIFLVIPYNIDTQVKHLTFFFLFLITEFSNTSGVILV